MSPATGSGNTRALLFDRLVETDPEARQVSGHTISRAELQVSVAREIGALLNTRIDPAVDAIDPAERTVVDYGLPDFTALAAVSGADTSRLARAAERAIAAFEPRLARPRVDVVIEKTTRDSVTFVISGMLIVDSVPESFTFPVGLGQEHDPADAD